MRCSELTQDSLTVHRIRCQQLRVLICEFQVEVAYLAFSHMVILPLNLKIIVQEIV